MTDIDQFFNDHRVEDLWQEMKTKIATLGQVDESAMDAVRSIFYAAISLHTQALLMMAKSCGNEAALLGLMQDASECAKYAKSLPKEKET